MAKKNSTSGVVTVVRSSKGRKTKSDVRLITTHANGAAFSDKRPGVIATIVEMLSQASEKAPVEKSVILAKLVERFPDRPEANMKSTLMMQVPSGLKIEKRIIVRSNEHGYWIDKKASEQLQAEYKAAKEAAKEAARVAAEKAAKEAAKGNKKK